MGMTGLVCALSRERRRMLHEAPKLVHDISDRTVEVPGRVFFDALRLSRRLAARLPKAALVIVEFRSLASLARLDAHADGAC
jgi:hypothetical protein